MRCHGLCIKLLRELTFQIVAPALTGRPTEVGDTFRMARTEVTLMAVVLPFDSR